MTRTDILQCVHEPFGDAYYYGPERLAERFANDEEARTKSGFSKSTYKTIMDSINEENTKVRVESRRCAYRASVFHATRLTNTPAGETVVDKRHGSILYTTKRPTRLSSSFAFN